MRKFFMGFGTVAMFVGMVWGIFDHLWLALSAAGMVISWLAAYWED